MRAPPFALLAVLVAAPGLGQDQSANADRVPVERLSETLRAEVRAVQGRATVQAPIASRDVRCKPSVYRALLGDLAQSARWLRVLGLGDYAIADRPDGTFSIDDKAGAKAVCTRALDEEQTLVVVARGTLDVPVLPSVAGTGVILVRYTPEPDKPGILRCRALVEFRLDSGVLHVLSRPFKRTLSQVLVEKMSGLIRSATELSEAIERDPVRVYRDLEARGAEPGDLQAFRRRFLRL